MLSEAQKRALVILNHPRNRWLKTTSGTDVAKFAQTLRALEKKGFIECADEGRPPWRLRDRAWRLTEAGAKEAEKLEQLSLHKRMFRAGLHGRVVEWEKTSAGRLKYRCLDCGLTDKLTAFAFSACKPAQEAPDG